MTIDSTTTDHHDSLDRMIALLDEASKLVLAVQEFERWCETGGGAHLHDIRTRMFASAARFEAMRMENLKRGLNEAWRSSHH